MNGPADLRPLLPGRPVSRWRPAPGGLVTRAAAVWTAVFCLFCCGCLALRAIFGNFVSRGPLTITPVNLGEIAYLFLAASLTYLFRKRLGIATVGQLSSWLWAHIYLGILGVVFVWFHSRQRFSSGELLANAAMIVLLVGTVTGILVRMLYVVVPRLLATLPNYDPADVLERRIRALETEARSFAAFKSPAFVAACEDLLRWGGGPPSLVADRVRSAQAALPPAERDDFDRMAALLVERGRLQRSAGRRRAWRRFLDLWWLGHVWVTLIGWILATLHAFDALVLRGRWS